MKNNDFEKHIITKLDQLARQHPDKPLVMDHVLDHIQHKKWSKHSAWKMTGFAVAAAVMGIFVLPHSLDVNPKDYEQQTIASPKLSPQMVEDLEMLSVFAEDQATHGS